MSSKTPPSNAPELLTRISNLPYLSITKENKSSTSDSLVISVLIDNISALLVESSLTTFSNLERSLAAITTLHPSDKNFLVIALPIPVAPPVTIATLSFNLSI